MKKKVIEKMMSKKQVYKNKEMEKKQGEKMRKERQSNKNNKCKKKLKNIMHD